MQAVAPATRLPKVVQLSPLSAHISSGKAFRTRAWKVLSFQYSTASLYISRSSSVMYRKQPGVWQSALKSSSG